MRPKPFVRHLPLLIPLLLANGHVQHKPFWTFRDCMVCLVLIVDIGSLLFVFNVFHPDRLVSSNFRLRRSERDSHQNSWIWISTSKNGYKADGVKGRGRWDFRFCGWGHFLDRFFGFRTKELRFFGFSGYCGFCSISLSVSGFRQNFGFTIRCGSMFFQFLFGKYSPRRRIRPVSDFACGFRFCWNDIYFGFTVSVCCF